MNRDELMSVLKHDHSSKRWDWFAELNLSEDQPVSEHIRRFRRWIDEIEEEDGTHTFDWRLICALTEHEPLFLLFVSGLKTGTRHFWSLRWHELAGGDALIEYSVCTRGAKHFLDDHLDPDGTFSIDYPGLEFEGGAI